MKKIITFILIVMLLGFSLQAEAALSDRGKDTLGNSLIYDSVLDITWYDFTKSPDTWQNQMDWAGALSVNFGGNVFDNWRLPKAVDGIAVYGDDGTTTAGHNITNSEMGHLYYTELGNKGWHDTSGADSGCSSSAPWCLTNTGDFQHLQALAYWSGTEYSDDTDYAWFHGLGGGGQNIVTKNNTGIYAFAVIDGDVMPAVAPEPISSMLFLAGGATLGFRRFFKKQRSV